jgi:D-threo-aldose 1-dehydrogenase
MKDSRISSTLCGVSSPESIEKNLLWSQTKIPNEFWEEVLALPYSKNDPEANRIYVPT